MKKIYFEADIYASQNYPIWLVGKATYDNLDEDVTISFDDGDDIEVSASEILAALEASDSDEDDYY